MKKKETPEQTPGFPFFIADLRRALNVKRSFLSLSDMIISQEVGYGKKTGHYRRGGGRAIVRCRGQEAEQISPGDDDRKRRFRFLRRVTDALLHR
jgi:RNA 3'-terminal phosphate cyclase